MWGTVVLMAVVAGVDPTRIGAVVFILSRSKPMRLLLAYFIGGFGLSLIIGFVVLFVLKGVDVGKKSSAPPEILIAVGALALLAAVLVGTGASARLRDMLQARHPQANVPSLDRPANADESRSIEEVPASPSSPNERKLHCGASRRGSRGLRGSRLVCRALTIWRLSQRFSTLESGSARR